MLLGIGYVDLIALVSCIGLVHILIKALLCRRARGEARGTDE